MRDYRVILTADLHQLIQKWSRLEEVVTADRPDLVLIAGDLLPKTGGFKGQREFFPKLASHLGAMREAGATVATFFGNDDAHVLEPLLDELAGHDLCLNLNCHVHRFGAVTLCGMPFVRDYPFGYKAWVRRDEDRVVCPEQFCGEGLTIDEAGNWVQLASLERFLMARPSIREELEGVAARLPVGEIQRSIWMIHTPPSELGMDICGTGERVGSPAVLEFIRRHQPLFGVSGHIHESPYQHGGRWVGVLGDTIWFQPGQMGERLHYVSLVLTAALNVREIRHSVFGPTPIEFERFR